MDYPLTHQQFYEGLKEGKLLGLKCRSCGTYNVPPKMCCIECTGTDYEIVEMDGTGELKTYTVVRVAPEQFEPPYIVAMAELKEGPWLIGNLEGIEIDQTSMDLIGKQVKVGYKTLPPLRYSPTEGVALTFTII
jgi:uncharacterized OB-fold protein